jgi:hypothetical protein
LAPKNGKVTGMTLDQGDGNPMQLKKKGGG